MHAVYSDRESCCCQRCQGSRTRRMRTRLCDSAVDSAALISAMPRRTPHRPSAQPTAGGRVRLASAGRPAHPNGSEPWPPEGTSAMTLRTSISGGRSRSTRGRSVGSARPRSPRAHTKACTPTRRHTRAHRHARTRASWAHAASTGACARSSRMRTSSGGRARSARLPLNALLPRHTTRITPRCGRTGDGRRAVLRHSLLFARAGECRARGTGRALLSAGDQGRSGYARAL